jgi:putative ABC transport system permease protein
LATRLSLRDIARNRSRTGPAVAAIMATLSGVVAMGVYTASQHARNLADFTPTLPTTMATLYVNTDVVLPPGVETAIASSLRATGSYAFGDGQSGTASAYVRQLGVGHRADIRNVMVGGAELLTALGIPQAAPALAAGKAVVITGLPLDNGAVTLQLSDASGNETSRSFPAVAAKVGVYGSLGAAVISPATATSLGLSTTTNRRLWTLSAKPTQAEIDAANAALLAGSTSAGSLGVIETEKGLNDGKLLLVPLALLAISTLVTFGVTAISTALSAAESKGDFATLSAVGATPGVRRRLAMGQAGVLALLGGILGIAAGLVPMGAVIAVRSDVLTLTIPWQVIALALVGVPLLAALGAGLFTRSRLPLARRLT